MASLAELFLCLFLHRLVICSELRGTTELTSNSFPSSEDNNVYGDLRENVSKRPIVKKERAIFPSQRRDDISNITDDFRNEDATDLDELLEIWNPEYIGRVWDARPKDSVSVSANCQADVSRYLLGVKLSENWAVKMMDASGRHNWGLFSGSRFWLGAPDQCRDIDENFDRRSNGSDGINGVSSPFRVAVNSVNLKLEITKPGLYGTHNVVLGLCLPASCSAQDVEKLLDFAVNRSRANDLPRRITFDHARNLSVGYTFWEDSVFYVLLVVCALVCTFVLAGTLYDIGMRYQVILRQQESRHDVTVETEMKILKRPNITVFDDQVTLSKLWSVKAHNSSLDVYNPEDPPKPLSEALLSFSLLLNISKLGSLDVGSDTLAPIHGLRFISLLWVILVHTCLMANEVSDNRMFRTKAEDDFLYQTISNGTYAVDTFFFMSGCLVAFLYFRTIAKERMKQKKITKGCFGRFLQFLGMFAYRYLRLTPPYLLVIGLIQVSMKWYHDHSAIELPSLDYKTCEKFWWRNALYINTYFDMDDRCMVWSWYLANDTQFYTIGIIILIISASFLRIGAAVTLIFLVASWITTAIISLKAEHVPTIQDPFAHYESLYDKPWTRIGPYLIGMVAGWFLFKVDCRVNINKAVVALGWGLSIVTMLSIVYGLYGNMFGPILSATYTALSHSGWALSVAWVLVACVTGYGGMVNKLLSWKYVYPMSRLTYCAYLVHPALMRSMILRGESSWHLTTGFVTILFFGVTVSAYAVSLFLSLFFEAPMVSLLRIVHPLRRWKRD